MSGASINKKLNKAYAKVGKILGYNFKMYRSLDYMTPVQDKNYLKEVTLAFSIDESFKKQQDFSFHLYNLYCDGADIMPGDIFENTDLNKRFTLVQNDPITVSLSIDSSDQITISRPTYTTTGGFSPKQEIIAANVPATILEAKAQGYSGNNTQPTPLKSGIQVWDIWTYLPEDKIRINDVIEDSRGNKSTVTSCQLTPLGYKIITQSTKA